MRSDISKMKSSSDPPRMSLDKRIVRHGTMQGQGGHYVRHHQGNAAQGTGGPLCRRRLQRREPRVRHGGRQTTDRKSVV